ncbi:MAG TPA: hypothetical protein VGI03_11605 [Verrucomicrobiae bacterium]|jgi:hypothetical protein
MIKQLRLVSMSNYSKVLTGASRFNGLTAQDKPLKRFLLRGPAITGLKPGVNEIVLLIYAGPGKLIRH